MLDGGLATTLESRGYDLDDPLWSAKILMEKPEVIRELHREFLAAGADCITTATYQASLPGFHRRGLTDDEGVELLDLSVRLAVEARDAFWDDPRNQEARHRPLVAASVGPYGAFLADGSEYTGKYGIGADELLAFHRERWHILAQSQADLLACETIPTQMEARVLLQLLQETPWRWGWFCFTCGDERHLSDGSPFLEAVRLCDAEPQVAGIGVNCSSPEYIPALIAEARKGTRKPIMVYPNAGERYDPVTKQWTGGSRLRDWGNEAAEWSRLGAAAIGGCCRVGPEVIMEMRAQVVS